MHDALLATLLERLLFCRPSGLLFSPPSGVADASTGSFFAIKIKLPVSSYQLLSSNFQLEAGSWRLGSYTVFFFATAPLRGPFRVRALVFVRWPRTGRFRR
jgi:hypothetical protein